MIKFIFMLIFTIYAYANVYSIQLYTATQVNKNKAVEFYNKLPENIQNLSVIYTTDSGYVTVRYLVSNTIEKLKNIRYFHNFSIVDDDSYKIKTLFLYKYKKSKNQKILLLLQKVGLVVKVKQHPQPETQPKIIVKTKQVKKKVVKIKKSKIPNWVKMNIALYDDDTYKIRDLLGKNIGPLQTIEALNKLHQNRQLTTSIFNYENMYNNRDLYNTYFDKIEQRKHFISNITKVDVTNDYTNVYNNFTYSIYPYSFVLNTDVVRKQNDKELILKYKNFEIGARDSNSSFMEIKVFKKFKIEKVHTKVTLGVNQKSFDSDTLFITTKNNFISSDFIYNTHNNSFNLNTVFAKYYYQNGDFIGNKELIHLSHSFYYSHLLNLNDYIKIVNYSNNDDLLESYDEAGIGFLYGIQNNRYLVPKIFINPTLILNSQTGIGYQILLGVDKRLLKADNLTFSVSYSSNVEVNDNTLELLLSYIYYF